MGLAAASLLLALVTQEKPDPDTSAKGLSADFIILEKTYRALHPGLERYNTPAQLEVAFGELKRNWSQDLSLKDAYLRVSEFTAKIKCGHTYANFFNQSEGLRQELFKKPLKLPYTFRWIKGTMVVTGDASEGERLPVGTEILAIDGFSTKDILKKLMGVAQADGNNDAKRVSDLEVGGNELEAFDIFYPLYFGDQAQRKATVRKPGQQTEEVVDIQCIPLSEKLARLGSEDVADDAPLWSVEFPKREVAVWRMPSWVLYNSKWDAAAFFEATFEKLVAEKTPHLVIDLRGNEGGDSVDDFLIPKLIKEAATRERYEALTKYRTVPEELRANLSTWEKSFYDWGEAAQPRGDGYFRLNSKEGEEATKWIPADNGYRGKVWVLMGPENSSATFNFVKEVKRLKIGTLVGRTSGGSMRGINGGSFFFLTLPNSKIEVDLPLVAGFPMSPQPDAGVEPDLFVEPSAADIAAGRDVEMERVMEMIGRFQRS